MCGGGLAKQKRVTALLALIGAPCLAIGAPFPPRASTATGGTSLHQCSVLRLVQVGTKKTRPESGEVAPTDARLSVFSTETHTQPSTHTAPRRRLPLAPIRPAAPAATPLRSLVTAAASTGGGGGPEGRQPPSRFTVAAASVLGGAALIASLALAPPAHADAAWPWRSGQFATAADAAAASHASMTMVPGGPESNLSSEELQTVRLFQAATPSVVNIANIQTRQSYAMDAVNVPVGTGSGFVWDLKGHIVTNYHVVHGANAIKVALIDSSVYDATFIAGDADKDVAVLQLVAPPDVLRALKPVRVGVRGGCGVCFRSHTDPPPTHHPPTGHPGQLGQPASRPISLRDWKPVWPRPLPHQRRRVWCGARAGDSGAAWSAN